MMKSFKKLVKNYRYSDKWKCKFLTKCVILPWLSLQGRVLSPVLFISYTNDYRSTNDRSFIVSLLNDNESEHGPHVDDFVSCWNNFYLRINVSESSKRRDHSPLLLPQAFRIQITSFVFDAGFKKVQQRFVILRKMAFFLRCAMLSWLY